MKYSTLEQILEYIIENRINLTINERKFLIKLAEPNYNAQTEGFTNITLEDFINWYNSPLRKKEITKALLTQTISKKELTELLALNKHELKHLEKYYRYGANINGYLILSYAKLKAYSKNLKIKNKKNHNREIIAIIAKDPINSQNQNITELIQNEAIYQRKDLIEKLVNNKSKKMLSIIEEILRCTTNETKDIISRYVELELDKKNKERVFPWNVFDPMQIASRRPRAKEAVLRQDTPAKMNQVLCAAANNGIYRNKKIFNLIQSQDDAKKMENIRILAKINTLRKKPDFFELFAKLDYEMQETTINTIYSSQEQKKEKEIKEKLKPFKDEKEKIEESIRMFETTTSKNSTKILIKTLNNAFQKYPKLKNNDTN